MGDSDQVTKLRMVGLSLLCYVSAQLQQNIGEIDCDRVKTGIEGLGGNKGGATRFDVAMGLPFHPGRLGWKCSLISSWAGWVP